MYEIELMFQISQIRQGELIELAEQERLIKSACLNQYGNQSLGTKIISLFKPSLVNKGNKGKTSHERSVSDLATLSLDSNQ